ncbi:MAG: AraC family transcriptional regulator [Myxococcota bacterium]
MRLVRDPTYRQLVAARDLVHDCSAEPLDLARIAAEAGLSPFHLQRRYRALFGETPHQALTRVRLARARELLLHSDLQVTDICFAVGFRSLGSFSALFAREVGDPPSQWRAQMRPVVAVPERHAARIVPFCFWSWYGGPAQDPRSAAAARETTSSGTGGAR